MSTEIVTGLLIAKNEEQDLPACLEGWRGLCTGIIIVDDNSTDATPDIAKSYDCRVISTQMGDKGFAGLRNEGLDEVETPMVLVFDADERPTPRLAVSILAAQTDSHKAYRMSRRNNAFGGWLDHGRFSPDYQTRLFPGHVRYTGIVHETPALPAGLELLTLDGQIEHFTYQSAGEYLRKMREYAYKEALQGRDMGIGTMLKHQAGHMIIRQGFLDGWRGFAMGAGEAWYDLMIRHHGKTARSLQMLDEPVPALAQVI